MRIVSSLLLLGLLAPVAQASFDLMYLPDAAQNRVHRFDPVNRVYLGSFSTAQGRYVAAHSQSPNVVVGASTTAAAYDAATGTFVNGASAFGSFASMGSNGNIVVLSGATSFRELSVPNFTNLVVSGLSGTVPILEARGITYAGSNRLVVGKDTVGNLVLNTYSSSGSFLSSTQVATAASIAATVATCGITVSTSSSGALQAWFTWRTSGGAVRLGRYNVIGNSTVLSDTFDLGVFSTANATSTQSVMAGHGGSVFVVGPDATTPTLTRIAQVAAFGTGSGIIANYTTNAFSVPATLDFTGANVIAPEPGTLAALSLGAILALRKRRRS